MLSGPGARMPAKKAAPAQPAGRHSATPIARWASDPYVSLSEKCIGCCQARNRSCGCLEAGAVLASSTQHADLGSERGSACRRRWQSASQPSVAALPLRRLMPLWTRSLKQ